MATNESNERWKKENTIIFSIRLQKGADKDILERIDKALAAGETKAGFLKRLVREQIAREQEQ